MPCRGLLALLAAGLIIGGCGDAEKKEGPPPVRDPLGEALAYIPRTTLAFGIVDTDFNRGTRLLAVSAAKVPATRLAEGSLNRLTTKAGLPLSSLRSQLGNPLVVAAPDLVDVTRYGTPLAAWVSNDPTSLEISIDTAAEDGNLVGRGRYRGAYLYAAKRGTPVYAMRGQVLVLARDLPTLKRALDRRAAGEGLTRAVAAPRLAGVPPRAPVRASADLTVALAGPRFAKLREIPWMKAAERVAASVTASPGELVADLHVDTADGVLLDADLPVAAGPTAPAVPRDGALRIGVRGLGGSLAFAHRVWSAIGSSAAQSFDAALATLEQTTGLQLDRDILPTLSGETVGATDLHDASLRATTADPAAVKRLLQNPALVTPLLTALGLPADLSLSTLPSGWTQVLRAAAPLLTVGVLEDSLNASTRQPDLSKVRALETETVPGAKGAVVIRLDGARLRMLLGRLVGQAKAASLGLNGLGEATLTVLATRGSIHARLRARVP